MNAKAIFTGGNRGILLDVVVFLLNVTLMSWLTRAFIGLVRLTSAGDKFAGFTLGLFFLGILVLPAAGSVLKRRHYHQWLARVPRRRAGADKRVPAPAGNAAVGCLLHPAFYLAVSLCLAVTAAVLLGTQVFGEDFHQNGATFLPLIFGLLVLSVFQTIVVYSYFKPPRKAPAGEFWLDPKSASLGDRGPMSNQKKFSFETFPLMTCPRLGGESCSLRQRGACGRGHRADTLNLTTDG